MGGVHDDDRPLNWVLRMVNMVAVILAMSERSCRIGRDAIIGIALTIAVVASSFTASSAATVTVAPGETLLGIADEYGTTVAALEAANSLTDPNTIVAGSVLQVPGPGAATQGSPTADRTVVVARGDTLLGIADQYGTTVDAIEAANHLSDPNRVVIGSVLQVPGTGSPAQTANNAPGSSGGSVIVAAGETLTEIADQYGTTVDALATLNDLADPNQVAIGSVLKIPEAGASAATTLASGTSGVTVTISPGQTLSSIAAEHGTTVAMLEAVNGIVHPDLIVSGMQLHLPPANTSALASDVVAAGSALPPLLLSFPSRVDLRSVFDRWAVEEGVSPALLEAMCWWESGWQTSILSVTGAQGVCQLESSTVADLQAQLGQPTLDPNVASDNIEMAAVFLHQLLIATDGDVSMALAGYYQGLASVRSTGLFPSTEQYVKGILAYVPSFG